MCPVSLSDSWRGTLERAHAVRPPARQQGAEELDSRLLSSRQDFLARRVLARVSDYSRLRGVFAALAEATEGDLYVFGGMVRRTLIDSGPACDLDVMVPNDDDRAFEKLSELGIRFTLNRRKHRRYDCFGVQLDVNQPQEWRDDFCDVTDALTFFDLRINSLAIHVGSGRVVDPLNVLGVPRHSDPGINWDRWSSMPPLEVAILAIRLCRILQESPGLTLRTDDADRLRDDVIPRCQEANWQIVRDRWPGTIAGFLTTFDDLLRTRSARMASTSPDADATSVIARR